MNFFFGRDRDKAVNRERFLKFREEVIDDILWLEFTRYYKTLPDIPNMSFPKFQHPIITDVEFCEHLLANANITSKQKKKMVTYTYYLTYLLTLQIKLLKKWFAKNYAVKQHFIL